MTPGTPNPDPYAAYGGGIASSADDPYAKYGGKTAPPANSSTANSITPAVETNPPQSVIDRLVDMDSIPPVAMTIGAVKSAMQVPVTAAKLAHKAGEAIHTGLGEAIAPQSALDNADKLTDTKGILQGAGAFGENIAEFMLGMGELKTLSLGEKMTKIGPIMRLVEKYPTLAKLLGHAIENAGVAGAQGLAHGEDPETSGEQALIAGGTGAAFEGLSKGASKLIGSKAATMEKVGGVDTVVPAEVRNAKPTPQQKAGQESIRNAAQDTLAGHLEEVNDSRRVPRSAPALPERTGPYEFNLSGNPPTEEPTTLAGHTEINGSGDSEKRPPAVVPAAEMPRSRITGLGQQEPSGFTGTRQTPTGESQSARNVRELGSTANATPPRLMRDQPYMTSAAEGTPAAESFETRGQGTMKTQDPNVARAHIANLNEIIDHPDFENLPPEQQAQIHAARADAQRQMAEYHRQMEALHPRAGRANLPQINVAETVKKIGSYTEASNYLESVATEGYNSIADALALNDISGGKFNAIRNANKDAWNAFKGASGTEAMATAERAVDETNRQMMSLLKNDIGGAVTPQELQGFNDAYGMAQKLKYVAHAVDGAFSGNPSASARSWEYRGFNGSKLMDNLDRLQRKFGGNRAALERVVGKENLDTLYQVAELNRTNAARARFGVAVKPVIDWLTKAGGAFSHLAPIVVGGEIGRATGAGWGWGAAAGEGAALATKRVMNMVLSNPKVAQNLIFAIDSGARPENYAPFIGAMIQRIESERMQEQTEEDKQK
jgi:hypothetical protein